MMNRISIGCAAMIATLVALPALGQTSVAVSALDDLYLAGQPSGTNCCNGDSALAESPVLAPITLSAGSYLTFTTTGGAAHYPTETVSPTADGDTTTPYSLTADYGTGISGPKNVYLNGLAGVFLGSGVPGGAAPAPLSGTSYASLSPGLNQIFFIGDGLTGTGTGTLQTFYVPTGATSLYLGIIDDGGYYDNHGTITATIMSTAANVSAVPEPAVWSMMIAGIGLVGLGLRRDNGKLRAV